MKNENIKRFCFDYNENLLSNEAFNNLIEIHYPNEKQYLKSVNEETITDNLGKISVIVPTYNRIKQLKICINSICSQTYKNFEIIIIDDCSNDETMENFIHNNDKRIKYIRNERNLGIGLNRQKGYRMASGDFIIFCDDDDYYIDDNYFSDVLKIFNKKEEINIICSNSYIHYEKEDMFSLYNLNISKEISSLKYLSGFQFEYRKPTSTFPAIFRKDVLEMANFSEMKMMNDSSIYLRALMIGGLTYYNNKVIGIYRVHGKNVTFNVKAELIVKNMIEKQYVYSYLKEKNIITNVTRWYEKEIEVTVRYFLSGNNTKEELEKVLDWVRQNVSFKVMIYFRLIYIWKKVRSKI